MGEIHSVSTVFPAEVMMPIHHARDLFRRARYPRSDAMWPTLRTNLLMARCILADSNLPGRENLHAEIDRYLGIRRPIT